MKLLLKEEPYVNNVGNLRMCDAFRIRKGSGMLVWYYVKKKKTIFDSLLFDLFPEFENSSRQTGRVTYGFHSPGSFETGIAEWASERSRKTLKWLKSIPYLDQNR